MGIYVFLSLFRMHLNVRLRPCRIICTIFHANLSTYLAPSEISARSGLGVRVSHALAELSPVLGQVLLGLLLHVVVERAALLQVLELVDQLLVLARSLGLEERPLAGLQPALVLRLLLLQRRLLRVQLLALAELVVVSERGERNCYIPWA